MALLEITREAVEATKRPKEGWYKVKIVSAKDENSKKSGKLMCVCDVQLEERLEDATDISEFEKKKAVYITYENFGFAGEFICAAMNVPSLDALVGKSIDLVDALNGSELQAKVKHSIYKKNDSDKGMEVWDWDGFLPLGAPAF